MNSEYKEPFVSVLTPVYNGEKYLRECIESVLAQTYNNWEYVLVNNCSTDRSLDIMMQYAEKEPRIRIYDNEVFLPQLENLNHAFRQISQDSKYCKVVHADDWIFPDCLTKMIDVAEKYPTVGVVSSYRLDNKRVGLSGLPYPSHFNDGREISRRYLLDEEYYFGAPTSLLLRSDLIRKRERVYDESYLQSDISACLDILQESDFGFVHQVLTFTRRHEESNTNMVAKKDFSYMFGYLKMHLDYGSKFLTDEEFDQRIKERIEIYYIQYARHLLDGHFLKIYKSHAEELHKVGRRVNNLKLMKYIFRESIIQFFKVFGIEFKRMRTKSKQVKTSQNKV